MILIGAYLNEYMMYIFSFDGINVKMNYSWQIELVKVFAKVDHITTKVVVLYIVRILKRGRLMISMCMIRFTKKIEATIPFEKCAF